MQIVDREYLSGFLLKIPSLEPQEIINELIFIEKSIDSSNINLIHPFMLNFQNLIIAIPNSFKSSALEVENQINSKIVQYTHFPHYKSTASAFYTKPKSKSRSKWKDILSHFSFKKLITLNIVEVENALSRRLYPEESTIEVDFTERIYKVAQGELDIPVKYLAYLFKSEYLSAEFISTLSEYPHFMKKFFLALYMESEEVYDEVVYKILCDNYRISPILMESLINISFDKMPLYNYEILDFFIKKRPFLEDEIIEKCKEVDKSLLLSLLSINYDFFIKNIKSFDLPFNDIIYSAAKEPRYLKYLLNDEDYAQTFNLNSFTKSLSCNEKEFTDEFFTEILNRNTLSTYSPDKIKLVERIIITYLSHTPPTEVQIKLFSSVFMDSKEYFMVVMKILPKDIILQYLERYLNEPEDLKLFTEVLSPNEILYKAHFFTPIQRAIESTRLCFNNKEVYNEDVLAQSILLLENEKCILLMRTVCFSLINFPSLDKFIISLLGRVSGEFWNEEYNINGFIKCSEILKDGSIPILNEMPERTLNLIFKKSPALRKNAEECIFKRNDQVNKKLRRYFNTH